MVSGYPFGREGNFHGFPVSLYGTGKMEGNATGFSKPADALGTRRVHDSKYFPRFEERGLKHVGEGRSPLYPTGKCHKVLVYTTVFKTPAPAEASL